MTKPKVYIWTDGACSGNPGKGGWGALLRFQNKEKEIWGGEPNTTNNRMELNAAIQALRHLKHPCEVELHTDSQYVKNGMSQWIEKWKEKNWKNSNRKPVKNADLWKELDFETQQHKIIWKWVRGHDGNIENEKADELARKGMEDY